MARCLLSVLISDSLLGVSRSENSLCIDADSEHIETFAFLAAFLINLSVVSVETGFVEAAARITSKANVWADWGSRGEGSKVRAAARERGFQVVEVAVPIDRVAYHGHGGLEYEVCTLHSWAWQIIQVRDCTLSQPAASQRSSHC